MFTPTRIVVADDHPVLRHGTAALLQRQPGLEVVGEARDGQQAVEMARALHPDIVLMDIDMPILSGVEATRRIRSSLPEVKVLLLSAFDDDRYVISSMRAGANAYLLKTLSAEHLAQSIMQVKQGQRPSHSLIELGEPGCDGQADGAQGGAASASPADAGLTQREFDVLSMLAQGMSNREIGEALYISSRTVQVHLSHIFDKLKVTSRLDAVMLAVKRDWLSLQQEGALVG